MWWMSRGWVGGVFELLVLEWGYCVGVRSLVSAIFSGCWVLDWFAFDYGKEELELILSVGWGCLRPLHFPMQKRLIY